LREDAYPSLGSTAWLLAGTLLAAIVLFAVTLALLPDLPQIVLMAVPTEVAMLGAVAWGVRRTGLSWRRALGLMPLPLAALLPLALVLAGSVTVFSEIYVVVQHLVPVPPEFGTPDLVFTVAVAVVLAPVLEEALFRGVILHGLTRRRGARSATFWTAAFFAFFHFYNPWQIVPTFFLGLLLGWAVLVTRSLWSSIVLHSAFNGLSLTVFGLSLATPDAPAPIVATGVVLVLLLGSAALLAGMAWLEGMTGGGEFAEGYPETAVSGDPPDTPPGSAAGPRARG
jgi:membrane protease YdiL (CAAX protease family)